LAATLDHDVILSQDLSLDGDNVNEMTISRANVIEPSDTGKQCVVICNFTISYPSLPIPISCVMFKDVIIIRPRTSKPTGKYGASFRVGIPQNTLVGFVRAAANSGYAVEGNLDSLNGHYWINCTTDDSVPALEVIDAYSALHKITKPCNTIAPIP